MNARLAGLAPLLCMAGACTSAPPPSATTTATPSSGASPNAPMPESPTLRLPDTFQPTKNHAQLVLDPNRPDFEGQIAIEGQFSEATAVFWLNAQNLTFERASITMGETTWPLQIHPQDKDFVGFRAPETIPAGPAKVEIVYRGKLDDNASLGAFRQQDRDTWYAFTQFESIYARRVFPCFDEPSSKVPWQLDLEVPEDLVAISNTPIAYEIEGRPGYRRVSFETTPPLPSYLIAFGVGPLDVVDAGETSEGKPIRIYVPQGRGEEAQYAAKVTRSILDELETYFGTPYPFKKLDMLTIPITATFGAMEHPGLITYGQSYLLSRPNDQTLSFEQTHLAINAHELAHQWFGNLVTMYWWDDIWLNEAFASWMGNKIVHTLKPEWREDIDTIVSRGWAMDQDRLDTARMIRQPIATSDDILNAFDGITYTKGGAVIQMFESWLGADDFREGVRNYLNQHARKNASSDDFMNALGAQAKKDVTSAFTTFLDRVGAPLVSVKLSCPRGKTPTLSLSQSRFLPQGSKANPDQTWTLPICVKYPVGKSLSRTCTLMSKPEQTLALTEAKTCPAWVLPNSSMHGYYRTAYEGNLLKRILRKGLDKLDLVEKIGLINDVEALVDAGRVDPFVALQLAARYGNSDNEYLIESAAQIVSGYDGTVPDGSRARYERFIRKMFGTKAKALGWTQRADESPQTRSLRQTLLRLVTHVGKDRTLAKEANQLARTWLKDPSAVAPDLVTLVLATAARTGDAALWDAYMAKAKATKDSRTRRNLLNSMGLFRDPSLGDRPMTLFLDSAFDPRESFWSVFYRLQDPTLRRVTYEAVRDRYDEILAFLSPEVAPNVVYVGTSVCEPELKGEIETVFKEKTEALPGGPRKYAQAMESLEQCVTLRDAQRPSLVKFLKKY